MKRIFKHYKTTIIGVSLAILGVLGNENANSKTIIIAGATALLGAFAKDGNDKEEKEKE